MVDTSPRLSSYTPVHYSMGAAAHVQRCCALGCLSPLLILYTNAWMLLALPHTGLVPPVSSPSSWSLFVLSEPFLQQSVVDFLAAHVEPSTVLRGGTTVRSHGLSAHVSDEAVEGLVHSNPLNHDLKPNWSLVESRAGLAPVSCQGRLTTGQLVQGQRPLTGQPGRGEVHLPPIDSRGGEHKLPSSTPTTTTLRRFHATEGISGGWPGGRRLSGRPPWKKVGAEGVTGKHPSPPPLPGRNVMEDPLASTPLHCYPLTMVDTSPRLSSYTPVRCSMGAAALFSGAAPWGVSHPSSSSAPMLGCCSRCHALVSSGVHRRLLVSPWDLGVLRDFESGSRSVARSDSHSYPVTNLHLLSHGHPNAHLMVHIWLIIANSSEDSTCAAGTSTTNATRMELREGLSFDWKLYDETRLYLMVE
ncbi:hypothetical protein Sjap_009151 [Stephania japonica]|uniref:Uncharacterized protein n=1 Tax=Stephania japonica TaxID=461633 RepID=A0AAP0JTA4_9MAGN